MERINLFSSEKEDLKLATLLLLKKPDKIDLEKNFYIAYKLKIDFVIEIPWTVVYFVYMRTKVHSSVEEFCRIIKATLNGEFSTKTDHYRHKVLYFRGPGAYDLVVGSNSYHSQV